MSAAETPSRPIRRVAAIAAVVVVVVVVAVLLFLGGGAYTVRADFVNAGQIVNGNSVEVGGVPVGSVQGISLAPDGQAELTLQVDKPYAPLRVGTVAVIRQASLSGIANRYVDLELPPGDSRSTPTIRPGGVIDAAHTQTAVDLDQLFNTFDPTTRRAVQEFFANSATQLQGRESDQQLAFHYLNPALATSSRLFGELNRDQPELARFLVDSAGLVNALAAKRDQLAALIGNLDATFGALGAHQAQLADSVAQLPPFMRQANSTFVDLRSALNDVDPLVNASKPVAPKLNALLTQLQPFARDAVPTVRDLKRIVFRPGPNNDLYDLEQSFPPLAHEALDTARRSVNLEAPGLHPNILAKGGTGVGTVRGAFPETARALVNSAPVIAEGRPYTPEVVGWFDDFSTTGSEDASGGFSRGLLESDAMSAFSPAGSVVQIPLLKRLNDLVGNTRTNQIDRCPGADEEPAPDGSNVLSAAMQQQLQCSDSGRSVGQVVHK